MTMDGSTNNFEHENSAGDEDTLPPHNIEVEQAYLGALLVNNDVLLKTRDLLDDFMFFEPVHGRIFDSVCKLYEKNEVADPPKLKPYFEHDEALADVGGAQYLVRLAASATTIINAPDYAESIRDLHIRRSTILFASDIADFANEMDIDRPISDLIENLEDGAGDLHRMLDRAVRSDPSIGAACDEALTHIEKACNSDGLVGVTTGLRELDDLIGGWQEQQLVFLGGRPKMGKTLTATNFARAAAASGAGTMFVSLEMSKSQLAARMITDMAALQQHHSIPYQRAVQGRLNLKEREVMDLAAQHLRKLPIVIDDRPNMTTTKLRLAIKRQQNKWRDTAHPLKAVFVDYLGLLSPGDRYKGSKVNEVSEITRSLKMIAKETGIPIVCLAQLNRSVDQRDNKRPLLSDLRDSGSIEQDADVVIFCYRGAYYAKEDLQGFKNKMTEAYEAACSELADLEGKIDLIVAAQRQGPTGTVTLQVDIAAGAIRSNDINAFHQNGDLLDGGV